MLVPISPNTLDAHCAPLWLQQIIDIISLLIFFGLFVIHINNECFNEILSVA